MRRRAPSFGKRRDSAERPIIQILESIGAQVMPLDRPVDLLVRFRGKLTLLEVKTPKASQDKRQEVQRAFCRDWAVPYVRTATEAMEAIGAL